VLTILAKRADDQIDYAAGAPLGVLDEMPALTPAEDSFEAFHADRVGREAFFFPVEPATIPVQATIGIQNNESVALAGDFGTYDHPYMRTRDTYKPLQLTAETDPLPVHVKLRPDGGLEVVR
jgi:hypothetical protein